MSDVVERLRGLTTCGCGDYYPKDERPETIAEEAAAEIARLRAQVASLKEPLQPTDEDIRLASVVREVATEREDMDLYIAANRLEQGQYYDCGDFGLVIENQDLRAQVASLTAAVEGERERCARVAERGKIYTSLTGHVACIDVWSDARKQIAAAIREGG